MGEEIGTTCESSCQTEMLDDVDANDISAKINYNSLMYARATMDHCIIHAEKLGTRRIDGRVVL